MLKTISKPIQQATIFFGTLLFATLFFATQVQAQVSIAPTSLFFDSQNRFGSLTISNGGQQAQEISISTEFGYPTSVDGDLQIVRDSLLAQEKSLASWMKVFPQNFTLQPNQRQVVRFVTQPPQGLDPGGYWSRVQVSSNPVSPPIESVEEGQVGAQINLVVNQVISAHFRTSDATTGVEVTGVDFTQADSTNTGEIAVHMEQTGNAPFIGSVGVQVQNEAGETVFETSTTNSVYTTITRTFSFDISDLSPGTYTVSGSVSSERRDISQDNLLQIEPVTFERTITIE
ncbi:hypothetical protein ACG2F4_06240 [Halalkalibaculum sp. DA3122]|uniref:hypothetical protein n=1 Tax=unclassified Halalkalibaculum TaxID=2964617 RepID=UPI0037554105